MFFDKSGLVWEMLSFVVCGVRRCVLCVLIGGVQ